MPILMDIGSQNDLGRKTVIAVGAESYREQGQLYANCLL
jgi:hypothetical protein